MKSKSPARPESHSRPYPSTRRQRTAHRHRAGVDPDGRSDASLDASPRVVAQRAAIEGAFGENLQRRTGAQSATAPESGQRLPGRLRAGTEALSGIDLSAVRVHRDVPSPAKLDALAYTRGEEIHLGPGQERHLPHEAWHVVQQRQGRVRPTAQAKGLPLNDDPDLEREADVMGARALALGRSGDGSRDRASTQPPGDPSGGPVQARVVQRINGGEKEQERPRRESKGKRPARQSGQNDSGAEGLGLLERLSESSQEGELILEDPNIDISPLEEILAARSTSSESETAPREKPVAGPSSARNRPAPTAGPSSARGRTVPRTASSGTQSESEETTDEAPDRLALLHSQREATESFVGSDVLTREEKLGEIEFQLGLHRDLIALLPGQIRDCARDLEAGARLLAEADDVLEEVEETETKANAINEVLSRPLFDVDVDESELELDEEAAGGEEKTDDFEAELEAEFGSELEPDELPMTAAMRSAYENLETALDEGIGAFETLTDGIDEYVAELSAYIEWLESERARLQSRKGKEPKNRYGLKSKAKKGATKTLQAASLLDLTPTTALINKGRQVVSLVKTIKHNRNLRRIADQCQDPETEAAIRYAASQKKKKGRRVAMQVGMLGPLVTGETAFRRLKPHRSEERNRQAQRLWNRARAGDPSAIQAVRDLTKRNFDEAMRREDGWKIVADKMKSK